jgi:hypothetical protein
LRKGIEQEEEILMVLMDRRRRLMEENEELEARRSTAVPLPDASARIFERDERGAQRVADVQDREEEEVVEEDLIDMAANERGDVVSENLTL